MVDRYLIVGLGNPGVRYANTRHNIGFRCVDALAERHGLSFAKRQGKALIASGTIAGRPVLLAKPQTYMNASGESVSALASFYKIAPDRILVIFDDLDLPVGTLRMRKSGGAGGQKGMKSIIEKLGTQEFSRLRFGIGRPPGRMDPADYVLLPFRDDDESILVAEAIDRVVQAVHTWLAEGIDIAMNQCNGSTNRTDAQPAPASARQERPPASSDESSSVDHPQSGDQGKS